MAASRTEKKIVCAVRMSCMFINKICYTRLLYYSKSTSYIG